MKKLVPLLVAVFACTAPQLASAIPINATFNGSVSGSTGVFTNVLDDFPAGTAASFDVSFDAALVSNAADINDYDLAPVSGWLRLGSLEWALDAGRIFTYTYQLGPGNPVLSYGLQFTGTGPTISNSGSLFGLFFQLTPDGAPLSGSAPFAGFGYPFAGGTSFSYADLAGTFTTTRGDTAVPEPNAGVLMCGALALLVLLRRRRVTVR